MNCAWGGYESYDDTFDAPFRSQRVARLDRISGTGVRAALVASRHAVVPTVERGSGLLVNASSGEDGTFRGSVP